MGSRLEEYNALKERTEQAQAKADRALGAMEALLADLAAQFGVDTIEDAEALAATLSQKATEATEAYEAALAAFEEEWADVYK